MKIINIREALLQMDKDTYGKHELTTMYESLSLTEEKKKELVKYVDAYDIDATNKFLGNEFSSQGLMEYYEDDDFSDEELASIYGGDTKHDIPDGIETPEEIKNRLNEDIDEKALKTDIKNQLEKFMLDFGFDTMDINDYTALEVKKTENGDMLHVEVRAELAYGDLTKLADKLDTVIQKYDARAYFEPVTSGIIEAFVSIDETEDEVEPIVVSHWTERFKNCSNLEELKAEYLVYRGEKEFMSEATQEEIDVVLDAKIDIMTANGELDESLVEGLDEGIFGKIGNAIKNRVNKTKNDYRMTKYRMKKEKDDEASSNSKKFKSEAESNMKDLLQGEADMTRAGKDKEELAALDRQVSGPKIADAPDYSKNKKGTTKTGDELDKAINDAAKKGEVYIADIGESLEEDFVDDDISFFKDEYEVNDDVVNEYTFKATKSVPDSDGFNTDYTWYECVDGTHVFVFGDNDIYKPEDGYFDHTCDNEEEAQEWFDSYKGFNYDDDLDESKSIGEDFANITSLADDCGKNTFKISSRDIRFTFDNEDDKTKFVNELISNSIPHNELAFGVVSVNKSSALDEAKKRKGSLLDKVNRALEEDTED